MPNFHWSDCAIYNAPAYEPRACNCGFSPDAPEASMFCRDDRNEGLGGGSEFAARTLDQMQPRKLPAGADQETGASALDHDAETVNDRVPLLPQPEG